MRVDISSCENKNTLNEIEGHIDTDAILSIHMLLSCSQVDMQVCVVGKYVLICFVTASIDKRMLIQWNKFKRNNKKK